MPLFRFTRPGCYEPGTPGHTNPSARQGYYVEAESLAEAVVEVAKRKPETDAWDAQVDKNGAWERRPIVASFAKRNGAWVEFRAPTA